MEELGKQNVKTVKAEVHETSSAPTRRKSPNRSPNKLTRKDSSPNQSRKTSPAQSRKTSPAQSRKTSPSQSRKTSPNKVRRADHSPKAGKRSDSPKIVRSPKKTEGRSAASTIKSSLKKPSRSLSIENPTCVECYLHAKTDKG